MSIPRDHHYVPKFYLKQWTGSDCQLCEYKRVHGRIHTRSTYPKGTGYQKDLYRVNGLPDHLAQMVESKFMHMVDTQANYAIEKLISGRSPWEAKMRDAWTRFILSLRFRNPEAVNTIKQQMQDVWKAAIENLRVNYDRKRRPTDPETFEGFMALTEIETPQKAALILLQEIIDNKRVGPAIIKMRWSRVSLTDSRISLLTSDRAIYMPSGLASKEAYIALPINPKLLFVADHDGLWADRLGRANPIEVVKAINQAVVSQARLFVWGVDSSQLRFIQNHMATAVDYPIITDKQKQDAIDAAAEY